MDHLHLFESSAHSPLQQFSFGEHVAGGYEFYVKRDDLIHPVVSGNKWRKLKYILPGAAKHGYHHIITFGGSFSNHLPAVAFACHQLGLASTAFVRGDELSSESNIVLRFCAEQGMNLHFVSRELYKNKKALFEEHYGNNSQCFFLDEGGYSGEAMLGCADLVDELEEKFDHICCAVGTGTTLAGIALGCHRNNLETKAHGVVVLKGAEYLQDQVQALVPGIQNYILHHRFHEGGYGKSTPQLEKFISDFNHSHDFVIEKIYTGKLFYAVWQLANEGYFKSGEKILLIHTGGLFYMGGRESG